jgi:hypothetical protein
VEAGPVRQQMTLAEGYPAYPAKSDQSAGHQLREKQRATKPTIFEVEFLAAEDMVLVFTELYYLHSVKTGMQV